MWMCNRCQAINDGEVGVCPKCGFDQRPRTAAPDAPPVVLPKDVGTGSLGAPGTQRLGETGTGRLPATSPPVRPAAGVAPPSQGAVLLTPSELMLFYGDRMVGAAGPTTPRAALIGHNAEVSYVALARMAVLVAFLANEQAGAVHFAVVQNKAMLGLMKESTLVIKPTGNRPDWPAGTLEAEIAAALPSGEKVGAIAFRLLPSDATSVEQDLLGQIADRMRERGLVEWENPNYPGLTWSSYVLSEYGRLALDQTPEASVESLVKKGNPDVLKVLDHEIAVAFRRRAEGGRADTSSA